MWGVESSNDERAPTQSDALLLLPLCLHLVEKFLLQILNLLLLLEFFLLVLAELLLHMLEFLQIVQQYCR
jgi:hypothetical protein